MKKFLIACSLTLLLLGVIIAGVIAWNWDELSDEKSTEKGVVSERELLGRWDGDADNLEFLKDGVCLVTKKGSLVASEGKYTVEKDHIHIDITTSGKKARFTVRLEIEGTMLLLTFADGTKQIYFHHK